MSSLTFINVEDVKEALGVSNTKAYQVIKELNNELAKKGYMVVPGRVSRKYFMEKIYQ